MAKRVAQVARFRKRSDEKYRVNHPLSHPRATLEPPPVSPGSFSSLGHLKTVESASWGLKSVRTIKIGVWAILRNHALQCNGAYFRFLRAITFEALKCVDGYFAILMALTIDAVF